jgi:hypothetical protein
LIVSNSLLLPIGIGTALVWANLAPHPYVPFADKTHFIVNDVGMTLFFGLAARGCPLLVRSGQWRCRPRTNRRRHMDCGYRAGYRKTAGYCRRDVRRIRLWRQGTIGTHASRYRGDRVRCRYWIYRGPFLRHGCIPRWRLLDQTKMGALFSLSAVPIAALAAMMLQVGRFAR